VIQAVIQSLYEKLILTPVERWYLSSLTGQLASMSEADRRAVLDQAAIGWMQTVLLIIAVAQGLFAGVLSILPPDLRAAFGWLHRIEWAAYVGILLVAAQAIRGSAYNLILTNRFSLLGWRLSEMHIVRGRRGRVLTLVYFGVIVLMILAILYVRVNGFIVRPTP